MSVNLQSCVGFLVSRRIERRALSSQRSVKFNRSDQPPDTEYRVSIHVSMYMHIQCTSI